MAPWVTLNDSNRVGLDKLKKDLETRLGRRLSRREVLEALIDAGARNPALLLRSEDPASRPPKRTQP